MESRTLDPEVRPRPWRRKGALLALLLPLTGQAAHLEYVVEVGGPISDVTPQRVLFRTWDGNVRLNVFNRVTGSLRTIPDVVAPDDTYERLTSRGVIYGTTEDDGTAVFEWTGAQPIGYDATPRGMAVSPVSRRYAIFPEWRPGRYFHLRDVMAGTGTYVGNGQVRDLADVGDDGQVVFTQGPEPYNVFRYRNGQTAQLTHSTTYSHFNPLTDGTQVVYRKQVSATASQIVLYNDAQGEVVLRPASTDFFTPREDYLPGGGWVAFTRINTVDGAAARQVWLRSPQGALTPVSSATADAYINAVGNGQVMFVSGGYLYLGGPGQSPVVVAPFADGTQSIWMQGGWYVYFGTALYRVVV
ncbi:hypothetical protein [Vulcaniibacterium tengchongense]|uniref:Uncharacterized protein n=1 Tax=Vulcaniibacterium tengchongense TaxID=1273429 RepID=A0A3N4W786_9GAMM|nr:hypothetical protein [Vulcaniibacterium tengchongense]RPE81950.1 hypothetical protein EDC50_1153 [Vulcaniibacterium tengchongense]